jgi:RNase H-fold protein (predicted Holliday junction resolvase)
MSEHGRKVEAFSKDLSRRISIPIEYFDERLTSAEARMTFGEEGINGDIDAESARLILERYEKSYGNINPNH